MLEIIHRAKYYGLVRLQEIVEKFGFLLDTEELCFKTETNYLKERCEKFGESYSCEVNKQKLYEDILDFIMPYQKNINSRRNT